MRIPIVDLQDNLIGFKDRAALDFAHDIFKTASVWITNSQGEVLLAQRKFDKKTDPGKWAEAVGGTVEGDESYETTARREAEEELGLKNLQLIKGPKQFIQTPCGYFVQWYQAVINKDIADFSIQPEEVERIAWISLARLTKELETTPYKYIAAMPEIVALLSKK